MKYLLGALFLILIVLLETSVLPIFPLFGAQLGLLLVILLALQFLGLTRGSYYGAFFGGILFDLLTGGLFSLSALVLLLLSAVAGLVRRFVSGTLPVLLVTTFIASVFFRLVQSFPTVNLPTLCKGGFVDVGLMLFTYPTLKYLLKSVFGRRELKVGV